MRHSAARQVFLPLALWSALVSYSLGSFQGTVAAIAAGLAVGIAVTGVLRWRAYHLTPPPGAIAMVPGSVVASTVPAHRLDGMNPQQPFDRIGGRVVLTSTAIEVHPDKWSHRRGVKVLRFEAEGLERVHVQDGLVKHRLELTLETGETVLMETNGPPSAIRDWWERLI